MFVTKLIKITLVGVTKSTTQTRMTLVWCQRCVLLIAVLRHVSVMTVMTYVTLAHTLHASFHSHGISMYIVAKKQKNIVKLANLVIRASCEVLLALITTSLMFNIGKDDVHCYVAGLVLPPPPPGTA